MTDNAEDGVLSLDDLELDDDRVRPLDESRFVVTTEQDETEPAKTTERKTTSHHEPQMDRLAGLYGAYALEVHARAEATEETLRLETNNVSEAFESLLRWYVERVAPDMKSEDAISMLLSNSTLGLNVSVE